jgi:hypothetical protein
MSNFKDQNDHEYIRNISHYNGPERRSGKVRRSIQEQSSVRVPDELTPYIKEYITESLENNKYQTKVLKKRLDAETRKTEAINSLITSLKDFIEGDTLVNSLRQSENRPMRYKKSPTDAKHKKVFEVISKMREESRTYEDIADHLEKEGIPTFSGRGNWHAQTIHRLCRDRSYKIFISEENET